MGVKCINCGTQLTDFFDNIDQFTNERFKIWECRRCGIGQTEVASDIDLSLYYPKQYYGKQNIRFNFIVEYLIRIFRRLRARHIRSYSGLESGRILDVGCGRGLMLAELKRYGWECFGIERSKIASEYARDVMGIKVETTGDLIGCGYPSAYFDVVCLWHVLEHMPAPLEVLKEIKRILKPNGLLFIEVPNFRSWQSMIARNKWIYTEAPRHLYHFSPYGLNSILEHIGFDCIKRSTYSLEFGFFGMIQSLLNLFCPKSNFLFFLMGNHHRRTTIAWTMPFIINLLLLLLLILPCLIIGVFLETLACMFGRGGVCRSVYRRK